MGPGLQICKHLVSRGFDVTIASDKTWAPSITAIGAHVSPLVVCIPIKSRQFIEILEDLSNHRVLRVYGELSMMRRNGVA